MKKNRPYHNQNVKWKSKLYPEEFSGKYDQNIDAFLPTNQDEDPTCSFEMAEYWKPLFESEMKKNKYRWRKMKDEKPKYGEPIFIYESPYHPESVFYMGVHKTNEFGDAIDVQPCGSFIDERKIIPIAVYRLKWRKMCKLPGDK